MKKILPNISVVFLVLSLLSIQNGVEANGLESSQLPLDVCRYGITSVSNPTGYPIDTIGVGGYLDWSPNTKPTLPAGVDHLRVLSVADRSYDNIISNLELWVAASPGSTWIVGNEPDTRNNQDNVLPEVYAQRFFEIATTIRLKDPNAHIAIGAIVQPTSIRMRYLDRVLTRLGQLTGNSVRPTDLIDIWAIHAFMLNEKPLSWGCGVPPGFDDDYADAFITDDISTTYSISLFTQRIANFRQWMLEKGEQGKPLWITEYGSLVPPTNAWWTNNQTVPDETTASFMAESFDYLLTASDPVNGMALDNHRLVQRWFWYSLNDFRYHFGGSLFDPDNNREITAVGLRFRDYVPPSGVGSDVYILPGYSVLPVLFASDGNRVDYLVSISVGTSSTSNAPARVRVSLYEGGVLVAGPVVTGLIQRCGSFQLARLWWKNILPGSSHNLEIRTEALDRTDPNPANNDGVLSLSGVELGYPANQIFMPVLSR